MPFNRLTGAVLLALSSQTVYASGFALIEQSASGQGLSYAGAAANAEDASVMWFNPAGLTQIEGNQAIAGIHFIAPKTEFTDNGSAPGGTDSNGAVNGLVPNLYWKGDYKDYSVGVGLNAPFGSKIEYDSAWAGRFQALKTDLKTYNVNVNFARNISNKISFGFGVNAQKVDLTMTQASAGPLVVVAADSYGVGYNLGLLANVSDKTDLGLSYRSEVTHSAKGTLEVIGVSTTDIKSNVTLPGSLMLSLVNQLNDKTKILADVTWTGWKAYDELVIKAVANGAVLSETNQNFKDSMRYSAGAIHHLDQQWKLRAGVARDLTPVPDAESRSPRTPDTDKTWLSAGFNYKFSNTMNVDVGYTKILGDDSEINRNDGSTLLKGDYKTSVDILSAQLVWNY